MSARERRTERGGKRFTGAQRPNGKLYNSKSKKKKRNKNRTGGKKRHK